MQRLNTSYFYTLAQKLIPLHKLSVEQTTLDIYGLLIGAETELRNFLHNSLIPPLTSMATGLELLTTIQGLLGDAFRDDPKLTWTEVVDLDKGLERFEIAMQADFTVRDTFVCSPKAAYSITLLAERGELVVSEAAHLLVPTMKVDIHDGCRCLAFELPTAGAFHFFRAVEAMVKAYGEFVRDKPFTEQEKKSGLGGYANLLKQKELSVDKRITNAVEQIASLHRNPTMHPEMTISLTEIMATLGMVVSVIETLTIDWNRRLTTPNVPLSSILPDDAKIAALLSDGDESSTPHPSGRQSRRKASTVRVENDSINSR